MILIVDDVCKPNDFECKMLCEILVKHKRHGNITLLVLAHSIERNNLHAIIKHFDYITFTNSQKNTPVFKVFSKKFCPKDFNQCMHTWNEFIEKQEKTHYLRYNHKESKFQTIDVRGNVLQSSESRLRKDILHYLAPFGDTTQGLALFDYLITKLPPNSVTEDDHIISLKNAKTSETIHVNILDLVYFVTRKNPDIPPAKEIIIAFRSIQKLYKIPYCFIANKHFL